jgi:hypothetical protein
MFFIQLLFRSRRKQKFPLISLTNNRGFPLICRWLDCWYAKTKRCNSSCQKNTQEKDTAAAALLINSGRPCASSTRWCRVTFEPDVLL